MDWKILDIEQKDGLITHAEFFVSLTDGTNTVEQQGTHEFANPVLKTPLKEVKEQNIIDWNIVCYGVLSIDRDTSTAIIRES